MRVVDLDRYCTKRSRALWTVYGLMVGPIKAHLKTHIRLVFNLSLSLSVRLSLSGSAAEFRFISLSSIEGSSWRYHFFFNLEPSSHQNPLFPLPLLMATGLRPCRLRLSRFPHVSPRTRALVSRLGLPLLLRYPLGRGSQGRPRRSPHSSPLPCPSHFPLPSSCRDCRSRKSPPSVLVPSRALKNSRHSGLSPEASGGRLVPRSSPPCVTDPVDTWTLRWLWLLRDCPSGSTSTVGCWWSGSC